MKMAVEKYRTDKNVVFLFIDCLERAKDPKESVRKFIESNKYPFRVLLDGQDATVVKKYGVTGIPVKFVIDGKGKIRFRVLGFDGGEDAAVEELSALIELARSK